MDVSVVDGSIHDKHGYSVVTDFEDSTTEIYYHYGKTSSNYSASYGVGFVDNYEDAGDYGGYFVDATASYSYGGFDYGIDICTDPSAPFQKSSAWLATIGVSFWPSVSGKPSFGLGIDYYLPVVYYSWS